MIDIETFGTKPNSVIVSIGAVGFNLKTGEIGSLFYTEISAEDCVKQGLEIDAATVEWWLKQSKEAQNSLVRSNTTKHKLKVGLLNLARYICNNYHPDASIWANSPSFDLVILKNAFEKVGLTAPWKHNKERDVRTLLSLIPEVKKEISFKGIKHYAIDDCKHQINCCCEVWKRLNQND